MAKVVINEFLCFTRHNFEKLTVSQLKPVLSNFYNELDICDAKDVFLWKICKVCWVLTSYHVCRTGRVRTNVNSPSTTSSAFLWLLMSRSYGTRSRATLLKILARYLSWMLMLWVPLTCQNVRSDGAKNVILGMYCGEHARFRWTD